MVFAQSQPSARWFELEQLAGDPRPDFSFEAAGDGDGARRLDGPTARRLRARGCLIGGTNSFHFGRRPSFRGEIPVLRRSARVVTGTTAIPE